MRHPRRDDQEELRGVYRAHAGAVYAFLSYHVSREVAEDLTATTFERVVRSWRKFDPLRASQRTWILSIAQNALTDHYRREARRPTVSADEFPALVEQERSRDDPAAIVTEVDSIKSWLIQLDERERLLVALRYGADMTAAEAAEATGLSVANVQQILSRCLRRLRAASEASDSA